MLSKREESFIRSLKLKKNRLNEGYFVVEGLKNVCELLNSDFTVIQLVCTVEVVHSLGDSRAVVVSKKVLNSISSLTNNDSCLAVAKMRTFLLDDITKDSVIICLDGVSDPGNLGTIIRSLDWYGFDQVICSSDCADFYNPKALMSSMGSFLRVRPVYTDLRNVCEKMGLPVYGLEMSGLPLKDFLVPATGLFVMGSESHGLRPEIAPFVSTSLTIPRIGQAESLNVAMATTVLLNHLRFAPGQIL